MEQSIVKSSQLGYNHLGHTITLVSSDAKYPDHVVGKLSGVEHLADRVILRVEVFEQVVNFETPPDTSLAIE